MLYHCFQSSSDSNIESICQNTWEYSQHSVLIEILHKKNENGSLATLWKASLYMAMHLLHSAEILEAKSSPFECYRPPKKNN
jgi:hypothetical protein